MISGSLLSIEISLLYIFSYQRNYIFSISEAKNYYSDFDANRRTSWIYSIYLYLKRNESFLEEWKILKY